MTIDELARKIDASLCCPANPADRTVSRYSAADTMSSLIAHAHADTVLVTSLNNPQLGRVAELMDAPAVCLVAGATPCPELLAGAAASGTAVLVAAGDLAATRARIAELLAEALREAPCSP